MKKLVWFLLGAIGIYNGVVIYLMLDRKVIKRRAFSEGYVQALEDEQQ